MKNIACIIMASGLSKRMEQNKLLLFLGKKMLFEYTLDSVNLTDFTQKIIVSSYDEILSYANKLDNFIIVENKQNHLGQSKSIILGIQNSKICDGFMFLPCDMPFINKDTLKDIANFFYDNKDCIIVPRVNQKNSMPTIFPYSLKNELLSLSGDIGGRNIIKNHLNIVKYLDIKNPLLLKDIDTKQDYMNFCQNFKK